jgi:hypothetical protein
MLTIVLINKNEMFDKFSVLPESYQTKVEKYIERLYKEYELAKELDGIKADMKNGEYTKHDEIDWDAE